MTREQRYLFDLNGYLHLKGALSEEELSSARAAVESYLRTPEEELPEGFGSKNGRIFENAFAWDKSLESLVFHPSFWPIVKEFTRGKPRLMRGSMLVNMPFDDEVHAGRFHCAREDFGWFSTRYECRDGKIFCDDFVIFPYFYDVNPGDGGLAVLPGSHKSNFDRPESLFNNGYLEQGLPEYAVNVTPKAGDIVIISELLTHGALPWTPEDRNRVVLILRYGPQYKGSQYIPAVISQRLSAETRELIAVASYTEEKEIMRREVVILS